MLLTWLGLFLAVLFGVNVADAQSGEPGAGPKVAGRPNILWIVPDDMSANFSCYGETAIQTPNVDNLAKRGVQFNRAFVTAPVCSTCRSAFITGMYQTTIGAHHHRSGRGELKIRLPEEVTMVPELFQQAGYYTTVSDWPLPIAKKGKKARLGKTDYNFVWDASVYDGADWSQRDPGQPFFAQLQTRGGKRRGSDSKSWQRLTMEAETKLGSSTPLESVSLPPYYPSHPDIVRDWAAYLDSVRLTDHLVGEVIEKLKADGDLENTLILFMTDHGISHARGKQFLYDEGIHVPLIIAGPGIQPGNVREDCVEHIDIAALSLAAAGIPIPEWMQAQNILASDYQPRRAVFSARDRCDETVDHIRSVRTEQLKYIRNFLPERPYLQPCAYKDSKSILIALRQWHDAGKLNTVQNQLFVTKRPEEELYDLERDPHELTNLASDPAHADQLTEMRGLLNDWMSRTNDQGRTAESTEMYDSDMKVYTDQLTKTGKDPYHLNAILDNIALMKRWSAEGK